MDDAFPWRDPADSYRRVHPRFADAQGGLHPAVRASGAVLHVSSRRHLRYIAETWPERLGVTRGGWTRLYRRLEQSAMYEVTRLIAGAARALPVRIDVVQAEDVRSPHEQILVGQHGMFLGPPPHPYTRWSEVPEPPTVSRGDVLAFYAGALLEGHADVERWESEHPRFPDYTALLTFDSRTPPRRMAAEAFANIAAFANTASHPPGADGVLRIDSEPANAAFIHFDIRMTDNQGQPVTQRVPAVVLLDHAITDDHRREIILDYGEQYWAEGEPPATGAAATAAADQADADQADADQADADQANADHDMETD
jgi:hypothetical protein